MESDQLREMTCHQVRGEEARLRERARRITEQVTAARAGGVGRPWTSPETGVDMSYEYEHWRRWSALLAEMELAGAAAVGELGPTRLEHWHAALDPESLRPPRPLSSFRPVDPLVPHAPARARRPFVPPSGTPGSDR